MDLGAAVGAGPGRPPWRVALVASSSWSHAFLCDHTWRLRPDTAADRRLYDALVEGDLDDLARHDRWSRSSEAGQQEMLNWFRAARARCDALGRPTPTWSDFIATEVFNSNKVFVTYEP